MEINTESLRFILGVKIKQHRQAAGLSLKELSGLTGLSVSYLSEIEKGKKYPKPEKIILLATALNKEFDDLVSLQLDDELNPLSALLSSPVLKEFPLQQFGIGLADIFELVNDSPNKAGAFIRTLLEITRGYDMNVEHFLLASLRSYQKMHFNYFEALEAQTLACRTEHGMSETSELTLDWIESTLKNSYQCEVTYSDFSEHPELQGLRSICPSPRKIFINSGLLPQQQRFVLARELGYRFLKLTERAATSSWIKIENFDQVFNHFKASYFAGALLIPQRPLVADLKHWLRAKTFDGQALFALMNTHKATPEMFLYRMSQLMPHHFGLKKMHYMRLNHHLKQNQFTITKELNLTDVFLPRTIGPNEHQCRRWAATTGLTQLANQTNPMSISAQRSTFVGQNKTFFNIAVVRSKTLGEHTNTGMTLGFLIDDDFKKTASFWNDATVQNADVNETCERCSVSDCESRAAPATLYNQAQSQIAREHALNLFVSHKK